MAEFIPTIESIQKDQMEKHTAGELALLNALQILDDKFQVYFQPHINFSHPDIVVVHETGGVLIIEVKDWNLSSYSFHAGDKIQHDYLTTRDQQGKLVSPFTQAMEYKEELYSIIRPGIIKERVRLGGAEKNIYGVVRTSVFFYNANQNDVERLFQINDNTCKYSKKNGVKVYKDYYYYWCKEDLPSIAENIKSLIGREHPFFTQPIREEILRIFTLSEEWIEQSEPFDPEKLNRTQKELVLPAENSKTRIKGAAGSGKTMVIAFKAINCYQKYRKPVLILTYNITLRNYICDAIARQTRGMSKQERASAFEVIHYDAFIPQVFKKIGVVGPHPSEYEDLLGDVNWKQYHNDADILIKEHSDLLEQYNCRYKTVLIDEAQDYEREWFELIEECFFLPEPDFMIVADQKQNIYRRRDFINKLPVVPGFNGPWKILDNSYRLSREALLMAKDFMETNMSEYGEDASMISTDTEGVIEYYNLSKEPSGQYGRIWEIISNFAPNGDKVSPNDICVLFGGIYQIRDFEYEIGMRTNGGIKFQTMCETKEEYDAIVTLSNGNKAQEKKDIRDIQNRRKHGFRMNPGTIKLCTIHSFKGWEINTIVIVIDKNQNIGKEHIYTALTRAKKNIVIIDLGGNEYGSYFENYIEKSKRRNRISIPEGYEISEKATKNVFTVKYGICRVIENIGKDGLAIQDGQGKTIHFNFDYYQAKNQACYVRKATKPSRK